MAQCKGLQIPKIGGSNPSRCSSFWSDSISVSISHCHCEETGSIPVRTAKHALVAQLVERHTCNVDVRSSILLEGTKVYSVCSLMVKHVVWGHELKVRFFLDRPVIELFPSSSVGRSAKLLISMSYVRTVPGEPH